MQPARIPFPFCFAYNDKIFGSTDMVMVDSQHTLFPFREDGTRRHTRLTIIMRRVKRLSSPDLALAHHRRRTVSTARRTTSASLLGRPRGVLRKLTVAYL